jgi:hypothetical protein
MGVVDIWVLDGKSLQRTVSQVRLHSVSENDVQVFEEKLNTLQTFEVASIKDVKAETVSC